MKTHKMKWVWAAPCTVHVWEVEEHHLEADKTKARRRIVTVLAKTIHEAIAIVGETDLRRIVAVSCVASPTDLGNERYRIARSNVDGCPESFKRPKS